jgi:hypothetical protein
MSAGGCYSSTQYLIHICWHRNQPAILSLSGNSIAIGTTCKLSARALSSEAQSCNSGPAGRRKRQARSRHTSVRLKPISQEPLFGPQRRHRACRYPARACSRKRSVGACAFLPSQGKVQSRFCLHGRHGRSLCLISRSEAVCRRGDQ